MKSIFYFNNDILQLCIVFSLSNMDNMDNIIIDTLLIQSARYLYVQTLLVHLKVIWKFFSAAIWYLEMLRLSS